MIKFTFYCADLFFNTIMNYNKLQFLIKNIIVLLLYLNSNIYIYCLNKIYFI